MTDAKKPAAPAAKAEPKTDPLDELPVELLDRWAASPGGWAAQVDASQAYLAWREKHPEVGATT